jgi:hypothetical protein
MHFFIKNINSCIQEAKLWSGTQLRICSPDPGRKIATSILFKQFLLDSLKAALL